MPRTRAANLTPARGLFLRGDLWWLRVRAPGLAPVQRSTGARAADIGLANDIAAMLRTLERQQQFDLLEAAAVGRITLSALYVRFVSNRLADARASVNDVDCAPLVAKWAEQMRRRRSPSDKTIQDYVYEVRSLIPEGEVFPLSALTDLTGDEWMMELADLGLTSSTQRRYGAALKVFCKWLRRTGVVASNPLREWELPPNLPPRKSYWTWATLSAVLDRMPRGIPGSLQERERLCVGLMAATGMELSAALATAGGGDVNKGRHMVFARGLKGVSQGKDYRQRWVEVRAWFWPEFIAYAETFIHGALLFDGVHPDTLRDHFYDAQVAAGLATKTYDPERHHTDYRVQHNIHDLRHTFCYLALTGEDGDAVRDLHYCKRQLGHGNLVMVQRIYANFNLESGVDAPTAPIEAQPILLEAVGT